MRTADLLILGAGPAGLGAAYRAASAGHDVVVVEREDRVGGVAGSFEVAGVRVDHGSHRLHHAIDRDILADLRSLLGEDLQRRDRLGRIRLGGSWLRFPLSPLDAATSLPPSFGFRAAFDALSAPFRSPREDSFAEVIRAGLGPTMLDRFYGPYAEKLWGLDPSEIAGEQARVRVSAGSPARLLSRLVAGGRDGAATFHYPRRGFGQISEELAAAADGQGAELWLGTTATALAQREGLVVAATTAGEVAGRRVWSTIPLPVLSRLWAPTPAPVRDHAAALRTRAMTLVYLVLETPRYTRFDAHYLPEGWTPITRISEPKNYRDSDEDPAGVTVLCAELPCQVGDAHWNASGDELRDLVVDTLRRAELPEAPVVDVELRRLPSAYPIYDLGYDEHVDALERWATDIEPLLTFGRQGLFVHDNTHHALTMAYAAADALRPDGGFDQDAWAAARQRFRAHRVED